MTLILVEKDGVRLSVNSGVFTQHLALGWALVSLAPGELEEITSSGAAQTLDVSVSNVYSLTLDDDCTLTLQSSQDDTAEITLVLIQDGTGGRSLTWPDTITWESGSEPTINSEADETTVLALSTYDGGVTWYGAEFSVGYQEYIAILNQSGSGDISETVLKDDFGVTINYMDVDVGKFAATISSGIMGTNNTEISYSVQNNTGASLRHVVGGVISATMFIVSAFDAAGSSADTFKCVLTIRVFS